MAAQNKGLQRRYDFQERALTLRDEELRLSAEAAGEESRRRKNTEEELSRVREELRISKLNVQQSRMRTPYDRAGEEEVNRSENTRRLREGNIHSADYNRREINTP